MKPPIQHLVPNEAHQSVSIQSKGKLLLTCNPRIKSSRLPLTTQPVGQPELHVLEKRILSLRECIMPTSVPHYYRPFPIVCLTLPNPLQIQYQELNQLKGVPVSGPSLTKYLREIKRGMAYFGSVSEISVHGRLAVGRWDMEGREWQDKATLLVAARKRERGGRLWRQDLPFKGMAPSGQLPQIQPHLLISCQLQAYQYSNPLMNIRALVISSSLNSATSQGQVIPHPNLNDGETWASEMAQ